MTDKDWQKKPLSIEFLNEEIDCIFAIDESGTPDLNHKRNIWFSIIGVYIQLEHFKVIEEDIMTIKNSYWRDGMYQRKRVVFHSRDIRKRQGPFNPKCIAYDNFISDIETLLSDVPVRIYSSHIHKINHRLQYVNPYPVYDLALEYMVERFCIELNRERKEGVLVLESRGIQEDRLVLDKLIDFLQNGNSYTKSNRLRRIKGIYFNKKRTKDSSKSYWSLELADLYAHSIHTYVEKEHEDRFFSYFKDKIVGYPNYDGKGIKKFP
ncbi:DUF3800 domain-containing protein [Enterococcus casseliflavus]|uniref:DUF3800 domain-containing protein n=1 Tax=Enterococcus casseliflavus TaxID=37734 RepID=UPI002DB769F6|nr:DUF3800 domain-containing protein [Enterococcus casseliflavus]MEB8400561.1 DUF3800 domain-containing protein [Enterococcus casseliflavus]